MPDAYNDVYLGQGGTGAAVILPQDQVDQTLALIQRNREQAQLQADKVKLQQEKNLTDAVSKFPTAWDRDYPALEKLKDNYVKANAFEYAQGRNPLDPNNPNYVGLQGLKQQTMDAFNASHQHQAQYNANQKTLNDNPKKFDVPGSQALMDVWGNMTLNERAQHPFPNNIVPKRTMAEMATEFQKSLPEPDQSFEVINHPNEGYRQENIIKSFPPKKQAQLMTTFLAEYPDASEQVHNEVEKLKTENPKVYKQYVAEAEKDGVTPEAIHALGHHYLPTLEQTQVTPKTQNNASNTIVNVNKDATGGSGLSKNEMYGVKQHLHNMQQTINTPGETHYLEGVPLQPEEGEKDPQYIKAVYNWPAPMEMTKDAKGKPVPVPGTGRYILTKDNKVIPFDNDNFFRIAGVNSFANDKEKTAAQKNALEPSAKELQIMDNNGKVNWELPPEKSGYDWNKKAKGVHIPGVSPTQNSKPMDIGGSYNPNK